ncbi:transmembrane protein 141 [Ischnura elegans]|uniref:transmembrane protein 141 n=1 Tax=Ischnura elegans TaxID=197161 RepID=UPI001ED8AE86|nr:transmembrane protein 141 [Ischnura elegans]XP_046405995.1 transmembrane protein 141 [Ischnura elegans]
MNNIKALKEQYKDVHPGFGSYMECMSRTLLTGLSSFTIAFAATYIGQSLSKRYLPYSKKSFVIFSSLFAAAVSYRVTSVRSKACQAGWMAAEEKHTYFTEKSTAK